MDENVVAAGPDAAVNFAEAVWRLSEERPREPFDVFYADTSAGATFADPRTGASEIAAVVNSGRGLGLLCPELYLPVLDRAESLGEYVDACAELMASSERIVPASRGKMVLYTAGYVAIGDWSNYCSPKADVKVHFSNMIRAFATDPRFAGCAGVAFSGQPCCEEEFRRWGAKVIRHYALEGATDDLAAQYGYAWSPGLVRDPDFEEGLSAWTVRPAEPGAVHAERLPRYGDYFQRRICIGRQYRGHLVLPKGFGDTVATFRSSAAGANEVSQRIAGLEPGRHYALLAVVADKRTLTEGTADANALPPFAFSVRMAGATEVRGLRFVNSRRGEWKPKGAKNKAVMYNLRYVFRADGPEATLVFADRSDGGEALEPGTELSLNYVVLRPYYCEDPEEVPEIVNALGWDRPESAPAPAKPRRIEVRPGASLEAVRDAVRAIPASERPGGVEVALAGGTYALENPLVLDGRDSGTPESPVVWCAADPANRPLLVGGSPLPASAFKPVTDPKLLARLDGAARGKVLAADISNLHYKWPELKPDMPEMRTFPMPEVYADGRRLSLAAYPAEGWAEMVRVTEGGTNWGIRPLAVAYAKGILRPDDLRGGTFEYAGDRPSRWLSNPHVLIHAYWKFDWRDTIIHAKTIDAARKTITMGFPSQFGVGGGNPAPRRWRAINVFEEIVRPGQYCVDFDTRTLYAWPPEGFADVSVCGAEEPLVLVTNACDIAFRDLHFGRHSGNGLELGVAARVTVSRCLFTDARGAGLSGANCVSCRVERCDFHDLGSGGAFLYGGDRRTLARAENAVVDCLFHDCNLAKPSAYLVDVGGVGNVVRHCELYGSSHQAAAIHGNDCLFEFNVVSNVCKGSDDCGAFYKGCNPSERGNVLRWNYFSDIGRRTAGGAHGATAVYLDDGTCGELVVGNVFRDAAVAGYKNFAAVFSHGGYSNVVRNCLFVDCQRAIGAESWDQARWAAFLQNEENYRMPTKLTREVDVRTPPYSVRYPGLSGILGPHPDELRWNAAYGNAFVDCPTSLPDAEGRLTLPGPVAGRWFTNGTDVVVTGDPGFVDRARGDLRLRPDSRIYGLVPAFRPIPFGKIGLLTPRK